MQSTSNFPGGVSISESSYTAKSEIYIPLPVTKLGRDIIVNHNEQKQRFVTEGGTKAYSQKRLWYVVLIFIVKVCLRLSVLADIV